ncbi:hypothetical protein C1646_754598 [Rhizophagus diaphanus]|nr:hypothetical protein C1646_754598 [Rhizophagus diaphanus] [Rhizophagus sp. MUCL 43196]
MIDNTKNSSNQSSGGRRQPKKVKVTAEPYTLQKPVQPSTAEFDESIVKDLFCFQSAVVNFYKIGHLIINIDENSLHEKKHKSKLTQKKELCEKHQKILVSQLAAQYGIFTNYWLVFKLMNFHERELNYKKFFDYELRDIWNCDETALFWRLGSCKTIAHDPLLCKKRPKERVSILTSCNTFGYDPYEEGDPIPPPI